MICAFMAAARLAELGWSRRNIASSDTTEEGGWSHATFPLILAIHTLDIGGTLFLGDRRARQRWLLPLLLVQPLRLWTLASLGRRWNARGVVAADMEVETGGPYAYIRHPNYAVVIVELFCLPAAFGLKRLALLLSAANALLLAGRIRDEEALLRKLPGYRDHFEHLPRLIPGLF